MAQVVRSLRQRRRDNVLCKDVYASTLLHAHDRRLWHLVAVALPGEDTTFRSDAELADMGMDYLLSAPEARHGTGRLSPISRCVSRRRSRFSAVGPLIARVGLRAVETGAQVRIRPGSIISDQPKRSLEPAVMRPRACCLQDEGLARTDRLGTSTGTRPSLRSK